MQEKIRSFFACNNIHVTIEKEIKAKQITSYFLKIAEYKNTTINKILKFDKALALCLQVQNVNIEIDGQTGNIIIQVPNDKKEAFSYSELTNNINTNKNGLFFNIGIDTYNQIQNVNLCEFPHLLIAGTTGSGKSVLVNSIILQLLENYTPKELELILIDIKQVEFSLYSDVPHLLYKPLTTLEDSRKILETTIQNMTERYEILKNANCKNIVEYNTVNDVKMKYKLIIIDELAELLLLEQNSLKSNLEGYDKIDKYICRIAQLGRACGIHIIVATQRPSSDVVSGLIRSNIPSRIALSVASSINSRIIIDETGAEKLTGQGDMLLKVIGSNKTERLQSAYISTDELLERLQAIKNKYKNNSNLISNIDKRNVLKELETYLHTVYQKSELKYKCKQNLQKYQFINEIIKEIAEDEQESKILNDKYFEILNKVTKYYQGYIDEEKQTIKEQEEISKINRRDKILTNAMITRALRRFNKWL